MAIPTELGVSFTPAEVDSMKTALNTVTAILRSKAEFNLSNQERNKLHIISNDRLPFARKSVVDYGVSFPQLNGLAYSHAKAAADMETYRQMFELLTAMAEAKEVATEMQMVAGHFCYKFMNDQYYNAKRYRGDNVAGAQVVYDGLKGCFEGQGPQGDSDTYVPLH